MKILYHDNLLAVVEKPPNMPCQPDKTGDADLHGAITEAFGYSAIINRLDRGVGGIVLFALNKDTAASLSRALESEITKEYLAVVCGTPRMEAELTNYLSKCQRTNSSAITHKNAKGAKYAKLSYKSVQQILTDDYGSLSLIKINLITGRHHQIRVQLNGAGIPIWGDVKYNRAFNKGGTFYKKALHFEHTITPSLWACGISLKHPQTHEPMMFESYPCSFPFTLFSNLHL